ncbi:hypothetical protein C8R47DRAFT_1029826, partial [Mycena vitilis]
MSASVQTLTLDFESESGRSGRMASCAECQRIKLKCDKKIPCGSCVRRGCDSICPTGTMRSSGRGKRSTMAHVPELNTIITGMGERIRELEQALATARGHRWDMQKPIDTLLSTPMRIRTEPSCTITPRAKALGSFNVNDDGHAVYFGPTAGPESLLSFEGASASGPSRFPFTAITESFPFSSDRAPWDEDLALLQLSAHLPSEERAWRLCETYYRNGCWTGMPIMQSETVELLTLVYHNIASEDECQPATLTQKMAVLYLVFALGSLVDLDLPSYSPEADRYFDLACAAMSIKPLFENPSVVTVQALTLLACYYSHGGPRFTMDGAWSTISLASSVSQRVHREKFGTKFPPNFLNRCRALFWETYSIETYYGLAVGRPTGTFLSDISCPFPPDEADDEQPFVKIFPGYRQARWRGTKEVTAPIMERFLKATRPDYDVVLDMDQRIRKYMHSSPFQRFPSLADEPPFAYIQRNLIPLLSKTMILYIHSRYFVEAIREQPTNPISSSYSASFLAAYLSASGVIETNKRNFTTHPELFTRWWSSWKSLFHAAIIMGIPATRYPKKNHYPHAVLGLITAVDLFEKGAASSFRAQSGLATLQRLLEKAVKSHSEVKSELNPVLPKPLDPEIQRDIDIFVGATRIIGGKGELQRVLGAVASGTEDADEQQLAPMSIPAITEQDPTPQSLDSYLQQFFASPPFEYV